MANKFTRFLQGVGDGLTNPKGVMGDWRHASKLFIDDTYRLSPRTKFLFYVKFELDKTVINSPPFTARHADEVGYLIKNTDLPQFKFEAVTKNQYNRKKISYKNFVYEPIQMTFHDDSNGVMNALWSLYMGAYVQDRFNPTQSYSSTALRPAGTPLDSFRYGLDKAGRSVDFIKSISIYTMSRRRFLGYTMMNPKITSWSHGSGDYSVSELNENKMTFEYEAVYYTGGTVVRDTPKGFANLYYDSVPSPLTVAGGGVSNLFGEGGTLDGLESIFGNIQDGTAFDLKNGGFLKTAILTANTARNASNLTASGIATQAKNIISSPAGITSVVGAIGGLFGSVFNSSSRTNTSTTTATQKSVVPPPDDLGQFL